MNMSERFKQCERTRNTKWYKRRGIGFLMAKFGRR